MNNNRNNNRRRGRGNRQQGGGNQNRIDSRARGNAPQMFDKYKKLAQDAAHNGDRVQAEYYLQFADHYFRVIADNKARQDEARGGRRDERDYQSDDEGEEDDFDGLRQPQSARYDERRPDRGDRPTDRQRQRPRRDDEPRPRDEGEQGYEGEEAGDFDAGENPFVRSSRGRGRGRDFDAERDGAREGEPRRGRGRRNGYPGAAESGPVGDAGEIDAGALPPSFSRPEPIDEVEDAPPKRKLPPRRRRPAADDGGDAGAGDTLKAVG